MRFAEPAGSRSLLQALYCIAVVISSIGASAYWGRVLSTCQLVNLCSRARILGHAMQKLPKRVLEFQGHQAAYDLTPTLGVALCCPFSPAKLRNSPIVAFCSHDLMIAYSQAPGTREEGMQHAPGRLSTLPGKAKRGSTTVPAQLQLRTSRSWANARSHWLHRISRVRVGGGRCAEERQPLDVVVGEGEKGCSRLMLFDMPGDMNHDQIAESSFRLSSLAIACQCLP